MNNTKLIKAICDQDIKKVDRILSKGKSSINECSSGRDPPIIECVNASSRGLFWNGEKRLMQWHDDTKRREILKLLVHYGADVNARSVLTWQNGKTALLIAAQRGYSNCLEFLVTSGANLNITCGQGHSVLMLAVMNGHICCVNYLTEYMPASMLNQRNHQGETALMKAVSFASDANLLCFKHLIEIGADIHVENNEDDSALMYALRARFTRAATTLVERGAHINALTHDGYTPLRMAVHANAIPVPRLLRHGVDLTLSRRDRDLLHVAIQDGRHNVVRALVMNGFPPVDLIFTLFDDQPIITKSPLALAIASTQPAIARYLIMNRFYTRYDNVQLRSKRPIRQYLEAQNNIRSCQRAAECIEILDFLSRRPPTLRTLCLVAISSALSQDFARPVPAGQHGKDSWTCKPSFRDRVDLLDLPPSIKRVLLHQTPSSTICCSSWDFIDIEKEIPYPTCYCKGECESENLD
ncbi:ankyrin repeat-containing protein [Elysia marginata]|uniref:Ankyrin repeat-containing protein n=1 Tax=Elysia marginata TaxID=1093978 RepID=A0AAV4FGR3_9GAST|nr:ankyrin repeat-containing protein [Elysia marginata]